MMVRPRRSAPQARQVVVGAAVACMLALAGCGGTAKPAVTSTGATVTRHQPGPVSLTGQVKPASAGTGRAQLGPVSADEQAFALDLLRRLAVGRTNLVLSPSSMAELLAMLEPGAAGATRSGTAAALHSAGLSPQAQAAGWTALSARLSSAARSGQGTLQIANQAWLQEDFPIKKSYLDVLARYFTTGVQEEDFSGNPRKAAQTINNWVAGNTGGHITNLLSPGQLQAVVAVLTDAVYFNMHWQDPFAAHLTAPGKFYLSPQATRQVELMTQQGYLQVPVSTAGGLDEVALPYRGGKLEAVLLMPPLGTLPAFVRNLTPGLLSADLAALQPHLVSLQVPRTSVSNSLQLDSVLSAMGMSQAFTSGADFLPISPRALQLAFVVQDAQLKMGELGTEASAASGAGLEPTAVAPVRDYITIVFDHPFLMLVRDTSDGAIVFEAQVGSP